MKLPSCLLHGLIDYAGLFPPAHHSMATAVERYAAHRQGSESWMLGRFVLPWARNEHFEELAAEYWPDKDGTDNDGPDNDGTGETLGAWPLSVLANGDPYTDWLGVSSRIIREMQARHGTDSGRLVVESVEAPVNSVSEVGQVASALHDFEVYCEIASDSDPSALLTAVARHGLRAKIRTGGITPDAIPSAADVARFLATAARHSVPFKATAGLHHPLRGEYPLTYKDNSAQGTMFGFLNIALAATLSRTGAEEAEIQALLEERSPAAFDISADEIGWRGHRFQADELAASRREFFVSYGSCSFREPIEDLQRLGLF